MPVVFRDGRLTYYFFSNKGFEPIHIHVRKGDPVSPDGLAKFWLDPLSEAYTDGFSGREKKRILETIRAREGDIRRAWSEHFGR